MTFAKFQRILALLILVFTLCGNGFSQALPELAPLKECLQASAAEKRCEPVLCKIMLQAEAEKSFSEYFGFLMKAAEELAARGDFQLALQAVSEGRRISGDSIQLLASTARRASAIYLFQGNLDSALASSQRALQLYRIPAKP